jgi:protein SCO1
MRTARNLLVVALVLFGDPTLAHHPGHNLDAVMGSKEKFFQTIDKQAPDAALQDAEGRIVRLADLRGKVVVLNFVYARCPDVCPLHAERIGEVQAMVNQTPMKQMVRFVSVTTDPANDTSDVLRAYGPDHGLDPSNWTFLTAVPDQAEDATRKLAKAFGHSFTKSKDGYQMHGVVTHVIDRNGLWRANFHGLRFEPVNLVLYLNGLTNEPEASPRKTGISRWWDGLKDAFR